MRGKKNKKVKNTVSKVKNVSNSHSPTGPNRQLSFDFTYKNWIKSINIQDFTNKLKGPEQFSDYIFQLIYKIFPTVQENWEAIKRNTKKPYPHCHTIDDEKKISLINEIIYKIHGKKLLDEIGETHKYWQLGLTQSVRVISIYDQYNNKMYPVFIDYHHLIYPSVKYNNYDYDKYNFCPYCIYEKKLVIKE